MKTRTKKVLAFLGFRPEVLETRDDSTPEILFPSRSSAPTDALSIPAVFRSANIISTAIGQLSVDVFRNSEHIDAPLFISQPSPDMSQGNFLRQVTTCLSLNGNAYIRVYRDTPADKPKILEVLNPQYMSINYVNNKKVFRYAGYRKGPVDFQPWQIQHLKYFDNFGDYGLSPLGALRNEIQSATAQEEYRKNLFSEIPSGTLSTDQSLTAELAKGYQNAWHEQLKNGSTAVLGAGLKYAPTIMNAEDVAFIANQKLTVTSIARTMGVPAVYLLTDAGNTGMTYSNVQQIDESFVRYTLMQYIQTIEDSLSSLLPRGTRAKVNVDSLLRSNIQTRYSSYKTAIEAGFLSTQEVRKIEGIAV